MNYQLLTSPLTVIQMRELSEQDENGYIRGVIEFDLSTAIDNDFEGFLDIISEALTGTDILMDINYEIVGLGENKAIHLLVSGDPSSVLECNDDIFGSENDEE